MTYTKKKETRRHLNIEYPVFGGEDCPLLTRFTDEMTRLVKKMADADPESRFNLTFSANEEDDALFAKHTLTVRKKSGEVAKRVFLVEYRGGYIKNFKEL